MLGPRFNGTPRNGVPPRIINDVRWKGDYSDYLNRVYHGKKKGPRHRKPRK